MSAILVSVLALSASLVEPTYERIGSHDGVDVYLHKDGDTLELAAVGEVDAPPAEVQAALLDYGDHARINAHLGESRVIARRSGEEVVYQRLKMPVISDRDFTLRVTWTEGSARGLRFSI